MEMFHDNGSKRREDYCKLVDESWKDISGLAQFWVIPPAEIHSGKLILIVKVCTDRMS